MGCQPSLCDVRGRVCPPVTQFPLVVISEGLRLFPALGGVGGGPGACPIGLAVSQARGAPSSRHGPAVVAGGIIPACPGWTQVEPTLTSGTRPCGPAPPACLHRHRLQHCTAQPPARRSAVAPTRQGRHKTPLGLWQSSFWPGALAKPLPSLSFPIYSMGVPTMTARG